MSPTQLLARLEAPEVRPETYLRAYLMALAAGVVRGKCCGRPGCEYRMALQLSSWLERRAFRQSASGGVAQA